MFTSGYSKLKGISAFSGRYGHTAFLCSLKALAVLALMLSFFAAGIPPASAEEEPQLEWESVFGPPMAGWSWWAPPAPFLAGKISTWSRLTLPERRSGKRFSAGTGLP